MEEIFITDVAARDGLQSQSVHVPTAGKLQLIDLLVKAGLRRIEATSFVSPKAVPQMADAADVLAGLKAMAPPRDALRVSVLVPNLKGLDRAITAGADEIAVVLSATEQMNRKNINMGLREATEMSEATVRAALAAGNLATEDLVLMAEQSGFATDIRLEGLIAAVDFAEHLLGRALGGHCRPWARRRAKAALLGVSK